MVEKFKNNSKTTLNGAIDASQTSIIVTSATSFPTSGTFRIMIENEYMTVTGVSSNTFPVTRGAEGSTAASHTNGSTVYGVITAGALDGIVADMDSEGLYSALPSAERAGRLYHTTDSLVTLRDTGSAWSALGPIWKLKPLDSTVNASFSWVNQGDATIDTSKGFLHLSAPSNASYQPRCRVMSAPATPYTLKVGLLPLIVFADQPYIGLMFRESSTDKVELFGIQGGSGNKVLGFYSSVTTSFSGAQFVGPALQNVFLGGLLWFKITNNGTVRTFGYSLDGFNFNTLYSGTPQAMTPNQIGVFVSTIASSYSTAMSVLHWEVT